ncbi:MAG: RNA-binding protein, partial [Verrucomicrobiota bacterium]
KSFWQKLVAFFTGTKSPATASARPKKAPASTRTTPPRKPDTTAVTSPKLYVGNLSFQATENDLQELFKGVGAVRTAEVVTHKDSE